MPQIIELHILQTLAPGNLNRDDAGTPKTATFGGVQRARLSSQSQKRPMRLSFNDSIRATRIRSDHMDRLLGKAFIESLGDQVRDDDPSAFFSLFARLVLSGSEKGVVSLVSNFEATEMIAAARHFYLHEPETVPADLPADLPKSKSKKLQEQHSEDVKKLRSAVSKFCKEYRQEYIAENGHIPVSLDLAAFGRLMASDKDASVEGAVQVAHALSVGPATPESDYFITTEDPCVDSDDKGAVHLGDTEFVSQTFYRYAAIDVDLLADNLGSANPEDIRDALATIVSAFIDTLPSGRQNTYAVQTKPNLIVARIRESGRPESWAGAFERPVYPERTDRGVGGYLIPAVSALDEFVTAQREAYGDDSETLVIKAAPGIDAADHIGTPTNMAGLLAAVRGIVR